MNLQCASVVINMDLPWNPAVLEQRIGKVHRLGQRRPVRVVNFIASGTIEHGMLSLLGFKKSLFAGVLDGGQDNVFLGGSRLKRFMESVEKVSTSIPSVALSEPDTSAPAGMLAEAAAVEPEAPGIVQTPPVAAAASPFEELISTGLAFLDKLGEVLGTRPRGNQPAGAGNERAPSVGGPPLDMGAAAKITQSFLETDNAGRAYLKLPAPSADTLKKIADVLYRLSGH